MSSSVRQFGVCAIIASFFSAPFVHAGIVFQDDFTGGTVGEKPAWTAVTETGSTARFRVANDNDPFGTGAVGQNNYLLINDPSNVNTSGGATMRGLSGASSIATISFDFVAPTIAGATGRVSLYIGQTAGNLGSNDRAFELFFENNTVRSSGVTNSNAYTLDTKHSIRMVMNFSAAAINYTGAGGADESLASEKYDLYVDGVKQINDGSRFNGTLATGTALSAFSFQTFTNDIREIYIDNVVFQTGAVVPEPAAMGLIGMGMGVLALRRRQKSGSNQDVL